MRIHGISAFRNSIDDLVDKTPNITAIYGRNIGRVSYKCLIIKFVGGKAGIRTLGTRKGTTVFETVPIDHSGTFPRGVDEITPQNYNKFLVWQCFAPKKLQGQRNNRRLTLQNVWVD